MTNQMKLHSVTLSGFRRFSEKQKFHATGKLTALIGPNEAGKSSVLDALVTLNDEAVLQEDDLSEGLEIPDDQVVVEAVFQLSDDQLSKHDLPKGSSIAISRTKANDRLVTISPELDKARELTSRHELQPKTAAMLENDGLIGALVRQDANAARVVSDASEVLSSEDEDLDPEAIGKLESLQELISDSDLSEQEEQLAEIANELEKVIESEKLPGPSKIITDALRAEVPNFVFFDEGNRKLDARHSVAAAAQQGQNQGQPNVKKVGDFSASLQNLAKIAGLDLTAFSLAVHGNRSARVATMSSRANERLKELFAEDWSQSDVRPCFGENRSQIVVWAKAGEHETTDYDSRSEGIRQFISLYAFAKASRVESPILLIDEADSRLHYDAQADLIKFLVQQNISPQIIYTTHSAGCLPSDLGSGVKVLEAYKDQRGVPSSKIKDQFWIGKNKESNEIGVVPLLVGLGATTLSFFPARHAVLTEGESDFVLLPRMFDEVLTDEQQVFQTLPGVSETGNDLIPLLAHHGDGVAFLLDSDEGGKDHAKRIADAGFEEASIFLLEAEADSPNELEDFLAPDLLAAAVNRVAPRINPRAKDVSASDFGSSNRISKIAACLGLKDDARVPKVQIASEVLQILAADGSRTVLDPSKRDAFEKIATRIEKFFKEKGSK